MPTVQSVQTPHAGAASHRPWIARHKFLTGFLILLALIVIGFFIWGWPLVKLRFHPLYAQTLSYIRESSAAKDKLGEPIGPVRPFPGGEVGEKEAMIYFDIQGPKAIAKVTARYRQVQGQWGVSQLQLEFPTGPSINLAQAIQQREGNDLPPFDPNVKQPEIKQPELPPDISLPKDLPTGPK
jgi:hypothetical protein